MDTSQFSFFSPFFSSLIHTCKTYFQFHFFSLVLYYFKNESMYFLFGGCICVRFYFISYSDVCIKHIICIQLSLKHNKPREDLSMSISIHVQLCKEKFPRNLKENKARPGLFSNESQSILPI